MNYLDKVNQAEIENLTKGRKISLPNPGDHVEVSYSVSKDVTRIMRGTVVAVAKRNVCSSFTVCQSSANKGSRLTRLFFAYVPTVSFKVTKEQKKSFRAKLFYLEERHGRGAKI